MCQKNKYFVIKLAPELSFEYSQAGHGLVSDLADFAP